MNELDKALILAQASLVEAAQRLEELRNLRKAEQYRQEMDGAMLTEGRLGQEQSRLIRLCGSLAWGLSGFPAAEGEGR